MIYDPDNLTQLTKPENTATTDKHQQMKQTLLDLYPTLNLDDLQVILTNRDTSIFYKHRTTNKFFVCRKVFPQASYTWLDITNIDLELEVLRQAINLGVIQSCFD